MSQQIGEQRVWGIHGGRTGDADGLFLKQSWIALGWAKVPDLSKLGADRSAFRAAVASAYPDKKPGAIPNNAGQLFRFVHEMGEGDLVVYPSKADRRVHIGKVTGGYAYAPQREAGYPHQRPIKWIAERPRSDFSQGALYEIGSAMSFFSVRNYADEFIPVAAGNQVAAEPAEDADDIAEIAAGIEEQTGDFIIKRLAKELKGHPFARFVGSLLQAMGFFTRVSDEGPDGGIDIVAHRDELGFEPPIIKVQVKSGEGTIGDPEVSALYGKVSHGEFGMFITLGLFSRPARNFARTKANLRLVDGPELVELILRHYDSLDAKYKGLLPLKRVYIPQLVEDDEDG